MIELFAKLINTYNRVDIRRLIRRAIQKDEFVRENTSLQHIEREEATGSENFFFIDDQQASIKRDVYLSFFVYKMLLTMKRYQKKHGESHQLIVIDEIEGNNSILENHVYRIISKIQDAEYEITEDSPRTFMHRPTQEIAQSDGVRSMEFTLEGVGKISVVAFGKRRGLLLSEPDVVSDYLMNVIKDASTVTHFYKLDMALREKLPLVSDAFSAKCCRILEESLPEETIRYFVLSRNTITKGSYAERHAVNLAIQAKEGNKLLIRDILRDMHKRLGMSVTAYNCIIDPISKDTETKILCKIEGHREFLSRIAQDRATRGWGSRGSQRIFSVEPGEWVDLNDSNRSSEFQSRFMDLDFGRQQGDIVARIDQDLVRRTEEQVSVGSIREDNDGDRVPIEARNQRQYPEESMREAFLRDWSSND